MKSFELRRYQPRAGHPDLPRLAAEASALADRLRPGLERPRRGPAELGRRVRSYATAARSYLRNRRLARRGRHDLWPLYFIWTTLRRCNFACEYCDDHRGRKYPDLSDEGVLDTAAGRRLLEIMRTGTSSVYFAGGEPTLRKDLPELARHARDLGYYPIVLNTNGSLIDRLLAQPRWRGFLADVDVVVVSLDALDLGVLDRLWVTRDAERVVRNLLLLRELAAEQRFRLVVNAVIQPGRVRHARDVLDLAADLGIGFCPVPMNVGPQVHGGLSSDPEYPALVEEILARKRAGQDIAGSLRMNQRLLASAPLDCRNTLKPHIDFDGRLAWPCKASVNVPPEWIDVLGFEDVASLWAHATARRDPTGFQGPGPAQCGASCNWAQNYTTDAYVHGLLHPGSLVAEVRRFLHA
jgi:MoaA/NifB/PqqE/SkfB family radical SAM enzyme